MARALALDSGDRDRLQSMIFQLTLGTFPSLRLSFFIYKMVQMHSEVPCCTLVFIVSSVSYILML